MNAFKQYFKNTHLNHFTQTVWAMLIGEFVSRITYFMSWPLLIILLNQKLGASALSVGLVLGSSAGISALIGIYIGYLSDKWGRKQIMLMGCLVTAICFLLLIFAEKFWQFFVVMALMGVGMPAIKVCAKAVISDSLTDKNVREFALYLRYFLVNLAGAIAGIVGIIMVLKNPNPIFIATVITYVVYLIWVSFLLSNKPVHNIQDVPNFKKMLHTIKNDRIFLSLIFANFLMFVVYAQLSATIPQIMSLTLDKVTATKFMMIIYLVNCLAVVLFQFPLLSLLKRFSPSQKAQIGLAIMVISQCLFMVIDKHSAWSWALGILIFSIGEAIVFPTINVNIDELAKPELRGSYFGAGDLSAFGSSLGPVLGGFMIGTYGDVSYFILTTVLCVLCIVIYQRIVRYQKNKRMAH